MTMPYDRDNTDTFGEPKKCGCCGYWFDLSREGCDYPDPLCPTENITLCGDCEVK